jgi:hypothetical protein
MELLNTQSSGFRHLKIIQRGKIGRCFSDQFKGIEKEMDVRYSNGQYYSRKAQRNG